jgi:FKBP-type peptidyl-prolyl cis-trans isomerase (trigger factor)
MTKSQDISIEKNDNCTVTISASVPDVEVQKKYNALLDNKVKSADIKGFRKGSAPKNVVEKEYGKEALLKEAIIETAIMSYTDVLEKNEIKPITRPEIIADPGTDTHTYTITVATMPVVELGDYKKEIKNIAPELQKTTAEKVTEKNVDEFVHELAKNVSDREGSEQKVDDAFAMKVGGVKTVDELKKRIKENLEGENEMKTRQEKRQKLVDAVLTSSTIKIPDILVEEEIEKLLNQFENELKRSNMTLDQYLETIKKTKDDIRNEWRSNAEKNVRTEIMLMEIAGKEDLKIDQERLDHETKQLAELHNGVPQERIKSHVAGAMTVEMALKKLEEIAGIIDTAGTDNKKGE